MTRVNKLADDLEALVDRTSLHAVLETLSYICGEKAEHLRSNWQDDAAARDWGAMVNKLERVSETAFKLDI